VADLQSLLDATAARERIWAIPGVRRIGFGLKETAGEVEPRWVFRVYVDAKRPAEELKPEELIPAEVEGFETDVLVHHESQAQCGPDLYPGLEITAEVANSSGQAGTLGCLVQKGGTFSILTCRHVIALGSAKAHVYQPSHSTFCGCSCNSPVGDAGEMFRETMPVAVGSETRQYWIDCGLVPLGHGHSLENELHQGTLDPHIRDLSTEALVAGALPKSQTLATALTVTKEGAKTDLTTGTVVEVCSEAQVGGVPTLLWLLSSKLVSGDAHYSITYDVDPTEPTPVKDLIAEFKGESVSATQPDPTGQPRRIHFEGNVFSVAGDSGSIWYDGAHRAVGLHNGGKVVKFRAEGHGEVEVLTGRGEACHIAPVFSKLGLDPNTGIVVGSKKSAGKMLAVPGALSSSEGKMEQELGRSETGRELIAGVRGSEAEVRDLIDHRRRVTLVWHRHKGPAFVATAINRAREGRTDIPLEVAGVRAVDLVRAMLDVLGGEGSAALRETVERRRALLIELVENCADLEEVVAYVGREPNSVV
jgi:hypothetical protein